MIRKRIDQLRKKFINLKIDGYIIPKNDEFFSEYSKKDRLKFISNLKGSHSLGIYMVYLFLVSNWCLL